MTVTPGTWTTDDIAGHPCDIYEPPQTNPHRFVAIYLHGVHQTRLLDNEAFTAQFAKHGLPVVVPLTGASWWADKIFPSFDSQMSAERYVRDPVLNFMKDRWQTAPPRIALLGTSMGGQGALRMAFRFPNTFPIVAAISPAIDYQLRFDEGDKTLPLMYSDAEDVRQDTATLHVHPLNWPRNIWFCCDPEDYRWHQSADRLKMKLRALGIPHESDLETTAGGHGFSYYNHLAPRAIEFLIQRLEQEERRVM